LRGGSLPLADQTSGETFTSLTLIAASADMHNLGVVLDHEEPLPHPGTRSIIGDLPSSCAALLRCAVVKLKGRNQVWSKQFTASFVCLVKSLGASNIEQRSDSKAPMLSRHRAAPRAGTGLLRPPWPILESEQK
jgi:hypothetical protein